MIKYKIVIIIIHKTKFGGMLPLTQILEVQMRVKGCDIYV